MARKTRGTEKDSPDDLSQKRPPPGIVPDHWAFFLLGQAVEEARTRVDRKKKQAIPLVAREKGVSGHDAKMAHGFYSLIAASPVPYLVRLGRIQTREGKPLSVDYLRRLAMADRTEDFARLLDLLERESMSVDDLDAELRWQRGSAGDVGGRRVTRPTSLRQGLNQVWSATLGWQKHYEVVWSGDVEWLAAPVAADDAAELKRRAVEVRKRLRTLASAATALEKRLKVTEARLARRANLRKQGGGGRLRRGADASDAGNGTTDR